MEIERNSWHYRWLKKFDWEIVWNMERDPDEYCNLCCYSRSLMGMFLVYTFAGIILTLMVLGLTVPIVNEICWVALSAYHWEILPEFGVSIAGGLLVAVSLLAALMRLLFIAFCNHSDIILSPFSKAGQVIGSLTGRFCVRIKLK